MELEEEFKYKNSQNISDSLLSDTTNEKRKNLDKGKKTIPIVLKLNNNNKSVISNISNNKK